MHKKPKRKPGYWKNWTPAGPRQQKIYTTDEEYELIAREAWENGTPTFQHYTLAKLIPSGAKARLAELRREHRKRGLDDTLFYHPKKLKELGLKVIGGTRRRQRLAERNGEPNQTTLARVANTHR